MPKLKQTATKTPAKTLLIKAKEVKPLPPVTVEPPSKQSAVIALLKRSKGATLEEMMEATGWQRHSVHGMLSGVVKKRLRLPLASTNEPHGRVYRVGA